MIKFYNDFQKEGMTEREKEGKKNTKKIKKELKIQAIKNKGFVVNH